MTRARFAFRTPSSAWLRYLPVAVSAVLVVLIAQTAAELTWGLVGAGGSTDAPAAQPQVSAVARKPPPSIQQLTSLHLFGQAPVRQAARPAPIEAPETRLNLVLRGLFATNRPGEALAIIADPQGKEKPYHEGDALPGGAELRHIYADRVILARNGQLETLKLRRQSLPGMERDSGPATGDAGGPAEASVEDSPLRAAASSRLRELREQYSSNPEQLWNEVRITPVMGDQGIRGYTLLHQDRQLMQALGLHEQDVITAVNGMSLSDPSVMYDVMNSLTSAQDLTLSIERNGTPQTLNISLN